jgi:hypothetical protein
MKLYPFVVFAQHLKGFDTLEEAKQFALANVPAARTANPSSKKSSAMISCTTSTEKNGVSCSPDA